MKKIFSAFLLMTMMVASVGSFVSCSDIEDAIAKVENTANDNAEQIETLKGTLATLQTALAAAQADAAAAKTAADKATQAAAQAQVEAIAAAKDIVEKAIADLQNAHKTDIDAVNKAIADLEAKLALKADVATVEQIQKTLEIYAGLGIEDKAEAEAVAALLAKIEAGEFATAESVATLVEEVKAINEKLAKITKIINALANQIQSIVYVPETADCQIHASGFSYAAGTTTVDKVLVAATYEVKPAELASAITAENAKLTTVPVKAAAAETFDLVSVEADETTGRVVVYANIASTTETYKSLMGTSTAGTTSAVVALTVNVASEVEEVSSNVSSEYTNIVFNQTFTPVTSEFYLYDAVTKKGQKTWTNITTEAPNGFEVPYNWVGTDAAKKVFFPYEVMFKVAEGIYVTPAKAGELLGTTFNVTYTAATNGLVTGPKEIKTGTTYKATPIAVTGNGLNATVQLVGSADYTGKAAIDQYAELTLGAFKIGTTNLGLGGVMKYIVVKGQTDAAVTFETVTKPWSYKNGDNAAFTAAELKELAVTMPAEITDIETLFTTETFTAEWEDANYNYTAEAVVEVLSSKAVKLISIGNEKRTVKPGKTGTDVTYPALQYPQGTEVTRTFEKTLENPANKTMYKVAFDVVLKPMPTDEEAKIAFAYNVNGSVASTMTVENAKNNNVVNPVAKAIEVIAKYDATIADAKSTDTPNVFDAFATVTSHTVKVGTADAVAYNTTAKDHAILQMLPEYNSTSKKFESEKSKVTINPLSKYENTIVAVQKYNFCGVDFTYTTTITTAKPAITFKPASAYVKADGTVDLDGTVKFEMNDSVTFRSEPYELNAIDLRKYVDVTIPTELADDFYIRYTLVGNPLAKSFKADGSVKEYNKYKDNNGIEHTLTAANLPSFADTPVTSAENVDDTPTAKFLPTAACPINWNSDMREMTYEIALVSKTQIPAVAPSTTPTDDVFGKFEVTLVVPELVSTFVADKQVKVKYENGKNVSAHVVEAITVTDKLGNAIYNPYATSRTDMWSGYDERTVVSTPAADTSVDFFSKVYDQFLVLPADTALKATINGTDVTAQVKPQIDPTTGDVTINVDTATLTGNVVVEVPVKLTYLYDEYGAQAKTATVQVVFEVE